MWSEIESSEVETVEQIGSGHFGELFRVRCRGQDLAMKKLFNQSLPFNDFQLLKRELLLISQVRHPRLVQIMGGSLVPGKIFFLTEYVSTGNLAELLSNKELSLSICSRLLIARDIASAMNWLHSFKPTILHFDLCATNILVDEDLNVKITDYGLSIIFQSKLNRFQSIFPITLAPEVKSLKEYTTKSDVYSFGILLYEIIRREAAFSQIGNTNPLVKFSKYAKPDIPPEWNGDLCDLIKSCLDDAEVRPSFSGIVIQLEKILMDIVVWDEMGKSFWRSFFLGKDKVSWMLFLEKFKQFFQLDLPDSSLLILSLKALICIENNHHELIVSLENWGKVTRTFGPLVDPVAFLENIKTTLENPWFHGNISQEEAEDLLNAHSMKGVFLIRLSSQPGCFTLSRKKQKIMHHRISHDSQRDEFSIHLTTNKNEVRILVGDKGEHLESFVNRILIKEKDLSLKIPCKGSKFASLFANVKFKYV